VRYGSAPEAVKPPEARGQVTALSPSPEYGIAMKVVGKGSGRGEGRLQPWAPGDSEARGARPLNALIRPLSTD
jgi:hypothetical protein